MKITIKLPRTDTSGLDSCNEYTPECAAAIMDAYAEEVFEGIEKCFPDAGIEIERVDNCSPYSTSIEYGRGEIENEDEDMQTVDSIAESIGGDGANSRWASVAVESAEAESRKKAVLACIRSAVTHEAQRDWYAVTVWADGHIEQRSGCGVVTYGENEYYSRPGSEKTIFTIDAITDWNEEVYALGNDGIYRDEDGNDMTQEIVEDLVSEIYDKWAEQQQEEATA